MPPDRERAHLLIQEGREEGSGIGAGDAALVHAIAREAEQGVHTIERGRVISLLVLQPTGPRCASLVRRKRPRQAPDQPRAGPTRHAAVHRAARGSPNQESVARSDPGLFRQLSTWITFFRFAHSKSTLNLTEMGNLDAV